MAGRRWPWFAAATLLLGAAAATAGSTYLHWLPCRGSMLSGSILRGFAYGPDFSDACLRRMDGGPPFPYPPEPAEQAPWAAELGIAAMVAAALAWLVLVVGLRWPTRAAVIAALPGLALLGVAVLAALTSRDATRSPDAYLPIWLWMSIDVAAVIALVAVRSRQDTLRLVLVLWGTTAFGLVPSAGAYIAMGSFSDANWDSPPGTGYLTAAALLGSAVVTLALAWSPSQELQDRGVPLVGVADQDPVRSVLEDHQH